MLSDWIEYMDWLHISDEIPARGLLRSGGEGLCAVGALCNIVDETAWKKTAEGYAWHGAVNGWPQGRPLPSGVTPEHLRVATEMNESGATFLEIADAVEAVKGDAWSELQSGG